MVNVGMKLDTLLKDFILERQKRQHPTPFGHIVNNMGGKEFELFLLLFYLHKIYLKVCNINFLLHFKIQSNATKEMSNA